MIWVHIIGMMMNKINQTQKNIKNHIIPFWQHSNRQNSSIVIEVGIVVTSGQKDIFWKESVLLEVLCLDVGSDNYIDTYAGSH